MRLNHPPDDSRFFARVKAAVLECPRCGNLCSFTDKQARGCTWDSRTARLRCNPCGLTLLIGVLAWPVLPGGPQVTPPRDQVPTERELAQLRGWGGQWMPESQAAKAKRQPHSNITARCTCRDKHITHARCPLHPDGIGNW